MYKKEKFIEYVKMNDIQAVSAVLDELESDEERLDLLKKKSHYEGTFQNGKISFKGNPLMAAIMINNLAMVKVILSAAGKDAPNLVKMTDKNGWTALMVAARHGNAEMVKEILSAAGKKANKLIKMADKEGHTALMLAASFGDDEMVQEILSTSNNEAPDLVKMTDKDGWTALMMAVYFSKILVVKAILKAADAEKESLLKICTTNDVIDELTNEVKFEKGTTALMIAFKEKNELMQTTICISDVDLYCDLLNQKTASGLRALDFSHIDSNVEVDKQFVQISINDLLNIQIKNLDSQMTKKTLDQICALMVKDRKEQVSDEIVEIMRSKRLFQAVEAAINFATLEQCSEQNGFVARLESEKAASGKGKVNSK